MKEPGTKFQESSRDQIGNL